MKEGMFRIGEAAEICGMTAKALRLYERANLVAPARVDQGTGYRYYSGEDLIRLDVVRSARAIGLGIAEIKALLEAKDVMELIECVEAQEERALARMGELKRAAASFASIRSALADCRRPSADGGVFMKDIPERLILSKAIGADPTIEDAARASASLERAVKRRGLTHRYESGIILSSEGESGFRPSAAFVVVEEAEGADASGLASIPAGRYVCIRYDESSAASRQKELGAFLSRKRIVPSLMLQADLLSAALSLGGDKAELQVLPAGPRGVAAASSAPSSGDRAPRRATKPRR